MKKTCSGKFVDCSKYGGYDPTDPCHQTCIEPRNGFKDGETKNPDANEKDSTR